MGRNSISETLSSVRFPDLVSTADQDINAFHASYCIWICMWMQRCPTKSLNGFLLRLFQRLVETHDFVRFHDDLKELRHRVLTLSSDLFTGLKWGRSLKIIITMWNDNQERFPGDLEFDQLSTILGWFKRLPIFLPSLSDEWKSFKMRCQSKVHHFDEALISRLQCLATETFGDFSPSFSYCKHGTGSTADAGKVTANKWSSLRFPPLSMKALVNQYPTGMDCYGNGPTYDSIFVSVPKQFQKNRFICKEPAIRQFYQQGLLHDIVAHMKRSFISSMVYIHDQEVNRGLCSRAVRSDYCTIDLSNASDCVSLSLIRSLFKHTPLYRYLYRVRTPYVANKEGDCFVPDFFSAMGSATTFPLETIVFSLIVEDAFRETHNRPSRGTADGLSVYGDDIICPKTIYNTVIDNLVKLDFEVNETKSFSSGPYRESCGVEYVNDIKVNSMKHPRCSLLFDSVISPTQIDMVIDLANNFLEHSFFLARRYLLKKVLPKGVKGCPRLLVSDFVVWNETGLLPPRLNDGKDVKWNSSLYCFTYRLPYFTNSPSSTEEDYCNYWYTKKERTRSERIASRLGYYRPVLSSLSDLIEHPIPKTGVTLQRLKWRTVPVRPG